MRFLSFFLFILLTFSGCGQSAAPVFASQKDSFLLPLGDTAFTVVRYRYDTASTPFFIHLHHNEQTADSAAHAILQQTGGVFLSLQNGRERLVSFSLKDKRYRFDPNRMFTAEGRKNSLSLLGKYDAAAARSVQLFAESLLALLPQNQVIALHNNRNGDYAITSYLPGGDFAGEAKNVFRNAEMDADDFVLTTDVAVFEIVKARNINAVLQNNAAVKDDGSLGYYFGKNDHSYINVEAEHGHFAEQVSMTLPLTPLYRSRSR